MDLLKIRGGLLAVCLGVLPAHAQGTASTPTWPQFRREVEEQIRRDHILGWSYIVSGGLSLAGGLVGSALTKDPAEGLVFTLFQNIGVASVGFGYLRLESGDERRSFYYTLLRAEGLSELDRTSLVRAYTIQNVEIERKSRVMKAITTGLLAAVNVYGAAREDNVRVRNGLLLIGVVNALACASFSFDF